MVMSPFVILMIVPSSFIVTVLNVIEPFTVSLCIWMLKSDAAVVVTHHCQNVVARVWHLKELTIKGLEVEISPCAADRGLMIRIRLN